MRGLSKLFALVEYVIMSAKAEIQSRAVLVVYTNSSNKESLS